MDIPVSLLIILASSAVALVSMNGALFFYISERKVKVWMPLFIAAAIGILLGDAFLHLIPDALEMTVTSGSSVALWTLVGIITFVFLEAGLLWKHRGESENKGNWLKDAKNI